jgi:hypothetical protein
MGYEPAAIGDENNPERGAQLVAGNDHGPHDHGPGNHDHDHDHDGAGDHRRPLHNSP